jgi:hypothetical protein
VTRDNLQPLPKVFERLVDILKVKGPRHHEALH